MNSNDPNETEGTAPTQTPESAADAAAVGGEAADSSVNGEAALQEQIAGLQKERDDYLDQWRRSAAEFQNFRKREERLRLERQRSASERVVRQLLVVMDDLQRAAQHVPPEIAENDWVKGALAIERKLWAVLEQEGVSVIEAAPGTEFDPNIHEALLTEAHADIPAGDVVQELQRGYRLHDTVLRPARVSVAQ